MPDSCFTEPPCPQGRQHLPIEAFTLDSPILEPSPVTFTQAGIYAPCTKSVYKAAHRRIRLAKPVSPSVVVAPLLAIANPPGTKSIVSNNFCDFHLPSSPTPDLRQRVILNGFSGKGLNKLAHALHGNHISWHIPVPHYRSKQWRNSFTTPNGMMVFDYAFYGKDKLWLKYYRRGLAYEVDTNRSASPRLYGTMLRSVASFGGGPGSRWTCFRSFKPFWNGPGSFPVRILRAVPMTFTNGTIYIMRASALTTFTLATLTTYLTTMGHILQSPVRKMQSIWRSRAATKTDELSGVLTEDRDQ